jgi:hypothetical protein
MKWLETNSSPLPSNRTLARTWLRCALLVDMPLYTKLMLLTTVVRELLLLAAVAGGPALIGSLRVIMM